MNNTEAVNSKMIPYELKQLEALRMGLKVSVEGVARKLEVKPAKYLKRVTGKEGPSTMERSEVHELCSILNRKFLYCPSKDIVLGVIPDQFLETDQKCPACKKNYRKGGIQRLCRTIRFRTNQRAQGP